MRLGFTGTQKGMTDAQRTTVQRLLSECSVPELHHGDCIGADADAHDIAMHLGIRVVVHPPTNPSKRAYVQGAVRVESEKPYLDRNHDIVDSTDVLLATPNAKYEVLLSGTWATIRYARKLGREIWLVRPDGVVVEERSTR